MIVFNLNILCSFSDRLKSLRAFIIIGYNVSLNCFKEKTERNIKIGVYANF